MSIHPDSLQQKCEIEDKITASPSNSYHKVIYYPKFHCELNHIEHFWCNGENYSRIECDYTLDRLQKHIPQALANVKSSTILGCYDRCRRKMQLHREGVAYNSLEWVKKTSYQKINILGIERERGIKR